MFNNFIIISESQKRIYKYAKCLLDYNSEYSFFSDYGSAFYRIIHSGFSLLIIDNVDENKGLVKFVSELRHFESLKDLVIIIITKDSGCDQGILALQAGANDYLSFSLVDKELAVRVKAHLNKNKKETEFVFDSENINLATIYPIEDRILLKKSFSYINNNISTLKKVRELADYLGVSERYINKIFTENLDETVFEYIRNFRIKKAKDLMLTTRILIVDIAEEVGYSSAENFSTAFKAAVGLSPTEYRNQKKLIKQ